MSGTRHEHVRRARLGVFRDAAENVCPVDARTRSRFSARPKNIFKRRRSYRPPGRDLVAEPTLESFPTTISPEVATRFFTNRFFPPATRVQHADEIVFTPRRDFTYREDREIPGTVDAYTRENKSFYTR
uniref:Uncharacterized protein n=1 Tax=Sipha flava TaxID=143950 RepID=A0A2S2QFW3_9HEMI